VFDLREPEDVLESLDDALRDLERDPAKERDGRELAVALVEAIAASGPLEMGVSPETWMATQRKVNEGLARLPKVDQVYAEGLTTLALRRLRRTFRRARRRGRWRSRFGYSPRAPWVALAALSLLLVAATVTIESLAHGEFTPLYFLPAFVLEMILLAVLTPAVVLASDAAVARVTAEQVAPSERWLLACRLKSRGVLIATDQRLVAAGPVRATGTPKLLWSSTYGDVRAVGNPKLRQYTVRDGQTTHVIQARAIWPLDDYQADRESALLAILSRRTPAGAVKSTTRHDPPSYQ
jgi:hypothetical protein